MTADEVAQRNFEIAQAEQALKTPTATKTPSPTATPKPKTFTDAELRLGWMHEDPAFAGKTEAEYLKTLSPDQLQSLDETVAAGKVPPNMQRALDESVKTKADEANWNSLGGPQNAAPPTDSGSPQSPDQLDPAEQQQILDQSNLNPDLNPVLRGQPSGSTAPAKPPQQALGYSNYWTNPSGQTDSGIFGHEDPLHPGYYTGGAGGVALAPSQNWAYYNPNRGFSNADFASPDQSDQSTPGFKSGGGMVIPEPARIVGQSGKVYGTVGEVRPEEAFSHQDGSVGIENHVAGMPRFAAGGTVDPGSQQVPDPTLPGAPTAPADPNTTTPGGFTGTSFPGTTINGTQLPGLNAGSIPNSGLPWNGSGNVPTGLDPSTLENQYGQAQMGLENYKNTFNTGLQNTYADINNLRQGYLGQEQANQTPAAETALASEQHARDTYDPYYGKAGLGKPTDVAQQPGTFGLPQGSPGGIGLRYALMTPEQQYTAANQPLTEYESMIGKTAAGVTAQISDASSRVNTIISALKGMNPASQLPGGGIGTPQQAAQATQNDANAQLQAEMNLPVGQTGTITLPSGKQVTYEGRKSTSTSGFTSTGGSSSGGGSGSTVRLPAGAIPVPPGSTPTAPPQVYWQSDDNTRRITAPPATPIWNGQTIVGYQPVGPPPKGFHVTGG